MPSPATSPDGKALKQLVAENIDRAITSAGRTNRSVAEQIGSTEHQVWRWRRGKVSPSDPNLLALAAALGVTVAWFYEPVEAQDRGAA